MKEGLFRAQINACSAILKQVDLDGEFIPYPQYPDNPKSYFKGMSYLELWTECLQKRYYHFQLQDSSLLYFANNTDGSLGFYYNQFPYAALLYPEFVESMGFVYKDVGEGLREEYDEYITTRNIKESINTTRYDLSYKQYVEGRHPVSHIHVGYDSEIRIRTEKIMGPLSFLLFVLRQHYPLHWKQYLSTKKKLTLTNIVRDKLESVESKYVTEWDRCELYLY